PLLRGALEAFRAIAGVARWEDRRGRRMDAGPWRPGWPTLAASRISYGAEEPPDTPRPGQDPGMTRHVLSERDSLALLRDAGLAVVDAQAVADVEGAVEAARRAGGAVALKLDAL